MKWLKKLVIKWVNEDRWEKSADQPVLVSSGSNQLSRHDGMSFNVYSANGGHIVQFNMYDRKRDQNDNTLHIIRAEDDFAESLAKIVTLEKLRA